MRSRLCVALAAAFAVIGCAKPVVVSTPEEARAIAERVLTDTNGRPVQVIRRGAYWEVSYGPREGETEPLVVQIEASGGEVKSYSDSVTDVSVIVPPK